MFADLGSTLVPLLGPFVADSDSGSEVQPRQVRYAKMPDYFSEFKDKGGELGCYLGSCILAKILISDLQSKLFMVSGVARQVGVAKVDDGGWWLT